MKFKEFLNKVEKEYFIDGEDYEELWEDESGYKQLLNEDNMSIPERLVLEKVRAKKKLKKGFCGCSDTRRAFSRACIAKCAYHKPSLSRRMGAALPLRPCGAATRRQLTVCVELPGISKTSRILLLRRFVSTGTGGHRQCDTKYQRERHDPSHIVPNHDRLALCFFHRSIPTCTQFGH